MLFNTLVKFAKNPGYAIFSTPHFEKSGKRLKLGFICF